MAAIPGLGQIPAQPTATSARRISLRSFGEWRFHVPFDEAPVEVRLLSGTAEKDGTELALQHTYYLTGQKSKIMSWHGCELEVTGKCADESVVQYAQPTDSPMTSYLNLHLKLASMRLGGAHGPRVLVAGGPATGKSSVARCLTAWATRLGGQPLVINTDPREGMLALPGTLSAAVFATLMDIESSGDCWGSAPTSGPGAVPAKLPLVFYYGHASPEDDVEGYKQAVGRISSVATARLSGDADVKKTGMIVDTPAFEPDSEVAVDVLAHIVEELSINVVVVLGSDRLYADLQQRVSSLTTSLGEPITVVDLDASDGVVARDEEFSRQARETTIKEYFFGDARATLSPSTQTVDADALVIYRIPDESIYEDEGSGSLVRVQPTEDMEASTLAVMGANTRDPADAVKNAVVLGFVYVADVDKERGRVKILAPVGGSLGDRPYIWGKWPEAFFNLLA